MYSKIVKRNERNEKPDFICLAAVKLANGTNTLYPVNKHNKNDTIAMFKKKTIWQQQQQPK